MTDMDRDRLKDLLPDRVAGRLDEEEARAVDAALARDPDLAAEAALLRILLEARPEPPEHLADRVREAVGSTGVPGRAESEVESRRWIGFRRDPVRWSLAAAAAAVVALGTTLVLNRGGPVADEEEDPFVQVALDGTATPWNDADGFVAGAPVLDDLSDEDLESLLEELGG